MRGRLGLLVGFGAGFYLGSMAGHERYEQINRMLRKARRSDTVETAADKAKAVVDLSVERAKDAAESHGMGSGGDNGGVSAAGTAYEQSSFTGTYTPTTGGETASAVQGSYEPGTPTSRPPLT